MRYGLIANTRKDLFWNELPGLLAWFEKNRLPLALSESIPANARFAIADFPAFPEKELPGRCDMILAIGGDGTILRTVHLVSAAETPILGVNVGGLGFLTEIPLESFIPEFEKIVAGEYRVEKRIMVKGVIEGDSQPLYGLNEILIDKGSSVRVIQIETEVDGQYLNTYIADGLLISTPTGSTGYSLSSGGPIVVPSADVLVINPVCPHSLTNRPTIIPENAKISVRVRTEHREFIIAADGQNVHYCPTRTRLTVERAPFCAHLVKPSQSNFFHLLHSKLNWGKDFRDKKRWSHDS